MTERLYYDDAYLKEFQAKIVDRGCDPCEVYLDRTAFYPTSGGQPYDRGTVNGVMLVDVVETGGRILHRLAQPVNTDEVECRLDWERRFDHMQQHSGQHLLSAVFVDLYGARTVSFHMGAEVSTIDIEAGKLSAKQIGAAERKANELVFANLPMGVSYEEASEAANLRGESNREGMLRIVSIEGFDRTACGGTHVRRTGEIGPVLLRKTDKVRETVRLEFQCGGRAVRQARADYDALSQCARVFSAALGETPAMVAAAQEKLVEAEKTRKRVLRELAAFRGAALYRETGPEPNGVRFVAKRENEGPLGDDVRAQARAFTDQSKAVYVHASRKPAMVLLAASKDSGVHAGEVLREALAAAGGRGGGNVQLAQGSLPAAAAVDGVIKVIRERCLGG